MATVHTGHLDSTAVESLRKAGFRLDTDDAGWIAEYTAGNRAVRVERIPDGWLVFSVTLAGPLERRDPAGYREALGEAAQLAVELATALNDRLRLVGALAGPLLAELRRTS